MKKTKQTWILGAFLMLGLILVPVIFYWPRSVAKTDNPLDHLPSHPTHTSHADIVQGPFTTPQEVTRNCLTCHQDAATQVMATTHWTWQSKPFKFAGRTEPATIGKINQLNNFCISAQGNQKQCMSCHIGYDWQEGVKYDFSIAENVDCLVCHADTTLYGKGNYGNPADGVDLLSAAQSVRAPTRENCGSCHFNGGGGDNVKHGDLDQGLYFPPTSLDVHMGANNFLCTDCHITVEHAVKGRVVVDNYQVTPSEQVACTDCHSSSPHPDQRLNDHTQAVACQTCHIPYIAIDEPTKLSWDNCRSGFAGGSLHLSKDQRFIRLCTKCRARIYVVQR
jgi:hypothetical protein